MSDSPLGLAWLLARLSLQQRETAVEGAASALLWLPGNAVLKLAHNYRNEPNQLNSDSTSKYISPFSSQMKSVCVYKHHVDN